MFQYYGMSVLDVWYASIDATEFAGSTKDREAGQRAAKRLAAARERSVLEHDFPKLTADIGEDPTIRDNPPLIYHLGGHGSGEYFANVRAAFAEYRESLQEERRVLLDHYAIKDAAMKVVGVGSVGTFCAVLLLMASEQDPLFLQVKQARRSVLEAYAGKSRYPNHGQRVVNGYRLMQSSSDIFLGWTKGKQGGHIYVRQLRNMKVGAQVELFSPGFMAEYAEVCGWALARAHARSGDPAKISGYLGKSDTFDEAIADFAVAYADQSERDHAILLRAVQSGRVEAHIEED